MHYFSDGSELGYGSVVYIRHISKNREPYCVPVISKSRLISLNNPAFKTIPRIELNGAKLSILLKQILKEVLDCKIDKKYFWTDSNTVLKYLNNEDKSFTRFIANRVSFILNNSEKENWHYIPSELNPADSLSRGIPMNKLVNLKWPKIPMGCRKIWAQAKS